MTTAPQSQYAAASADLPAVHTAPWLEACGSPDEPVGVFPNGTKVTVIGAGFSGIQLAKMATRCGAKVTVIEAHTEAGGRLRAEWLSNQVFSHKAAMRFGKATAELEDLIKPKGYTLEGAPFINIGVVPSLLFPEKNQKPVLWDDANGIVPDIYTKVLKGLRCAQEEPVRIGSVTLPSFNDLRSRLADPATDKTALRADLQRYIDQTNGLDLLQFYTKFFVTNPTPPGGQRWTEDDVKRCIDVYRTGRHDVFTSISAWADLKWLLNGSTVDQTFFSKIGEGQPMPGDFPGEFNLEALRMPVTKLGNVHDFVLEEAAKLEERGVTIHYGTKVTGFEKPPAKGKLNRRVRASNVEGEMFVDADLVFVTTTIPAAVEMGLAGKGKNQHLDDKVCDAMTNVFTTPTSKLEWTVSAQPWIDDPTLPRNVQFASPFCPVYVIFEKGASVAKVHAYAWADDAKRLEAMGDGATIRKNLIAHAREVLHDTEYARLADAITSDSGVVVAHWQSDRMALGGWTFPLAGQDKSASDIQYNLLSGRGIYLCGSSAGGDDAWIKSGLRNAVLALNAGLRVTKGRVYHEDIAPLGQMGEPFNYPTASLT